MVIKTFLLLCSLSLFSANAESLILPSEQEITIEEYGKPSSTNHILWLHSERGISGELQKILLTISKQQDIHILLPDWLDSYFIEPSRSSLEKIPQQDFRDLISHYSKQFTGKDKLFIVASSRASSLALNTLHYLQTQSVDSVDGVILISAYLQKQTPSIGDRMEYQTIASHSNLPLYVFQAERSPRFVPLPLLIKELEKGGSAVYTHILENTSGGFHAREKSDLTAVDLKAREAFPKQLANALNLLKITPKAPLKLLQDYEKNIRKRSPLALQKIALNTPTLVLKDLDGKTHNLKDYKDKVVLISFWASWCRPCIEEMPSLVKLKEKYQENLEILAVNVREDIATIKQFTQPMNINFPLLQDHDSSTVTDWKVYVYPSNFIVNKKGELVYAATGAMDWQEKDIEKVIESLF